MLYSSLRRVSSVILVGKALYKRFLPYFDQEKVHVVHNGYLPTPWHINKSVKLGVNFKNIDKYRIISISNLHEEKGIHVLIHALHNLKKKGYHHWEYTIVGDGYFRSNLQHLVQSLNLCDYIKFTGRCDHADVYKYLIHNHIFCLPSYREAFGIANLEAMSMGLLSIAVVDQGTSEYINDGVTGLLVKPQSIDDLVDKLITVFDNPIKATEIARAGKILVENEYQWKHHAKNVFILYQNLIN